MVGGDLARLKGMMGIKVRDELRQGLFRIHPQPLEREQNRGFVCQMRA